MLVLSRKMGEKLVIGDREVIDDDLTIEVLEISGSRVKLGITAPKNVFVHRHEVWLKNQAVRKENK